MIRDGRRPSLSPTGAATRAPTKVPALRMETNRDDCAGVRFGMLSFVSMYPVENCLLKYCMAMIPLIVPVSYPNKMPPKATNKPVTLRSASFVGMQMEKPYLS